MGFWEPQPTKVNNAQKKDRPPLPPFSHKKMGEGTESVASPSFSQRFAIFDSLVKKLGGSGRYLLNSSTILVNAAGSRSTISIRCIVAPAVS